MKNDLMSPTQTMAAYQIGDRDHRPWGSYVVTGVGTSDSGEEYCEKEITVNPGEVLSLQSHEHRREHWIVKSGTLTVVLDGTRSDLPAGADIRIPLGGIHAMANLGTEPCIVYERQEGTCREDDIKRYIDAYGRATEGLVSPTAEKSIAVYGDILRQRKS